MSTLLQVGDQIRIEKGMKVFANIPARFLEGGASRFNNRKVIQWQIVVGEVFKKEKIEKSDLVSQLLIATSDIIPVSKASIEKLVDSLHLFLEEETYDTGKIYTGDYTVYRVEDFASEREIFAMKNDDSAEYIIFLQVKE